LFLIFFMFLQVHDGKKRIASRHTVVIFSFFFFPPLHFLLLLLYLQPSLGVRRDDVNSVQPVIYL
jgi:hypothetical protein